MRVNDYEETAAVESATPTISIPSVVVSIILLAGVFALLVASDVGWVTLTTVAIFAALVMPLGIASAKYQSVEQAIERWYAAGNKFLALIFLALLPIVASNAIAQLVIAWVSPWAQGSAFVVWAFLLGCAIWWIATERNRERFFRVIGSGSSDNPPSQSKVPRLTPILFSFDVLVIAAMFFSSFTFVLVQNGVAQLSGANVTYDSLLSFYIWHFLEAIPLIKVNDTLQWKAPLTYQSTAIGLMVLLFKIVVIIPVIAAFAWHWKKITTDIEPEAETRRVILSSEVKA